MGDNMDPGMPHLLDRREPVVLLGPTMDLSIYPASAYLPCI